MLRLGLRMIRGLAREDALALAHELEQGNRFHDLADLRRRTGLGPGAHGYEPSGRRTWNSPELEAWLSNPAGAWELPDRAQRAQDLVLSTLRHVDGLSLERLAAETGYTISPDGLSALERGGTIGLEGTAVVLTDEGFPLADAVIGRLCRALVTSAPVE